MSHKSRSGYSKKPVKKTNIIIQLDDDLKIKFQKMCKDNDMTCSQVLRKFMRSALNSGFANLR